MLESEINVAYDTIHGSVNPEIHHYRNSSHPGSKWYIKTVIPGPNIITTETKFILEFWKRLQIGHPYLITLSESAFLWSGIPMHNWWTVWLNQRIDIDYTLEKSNDIHYKIIEYDTGLKSSGEKLIKWLKLTQGVDRLASEQQINYNSLNDVAEFIRTYTSDAESKKKRLNFKVIDNEEV